MININHTKYIKFLIFSLFIFFVGFSLNNIIWAAVGDIDSGIGSVGSDIDANDIEALSNSNVWLVADGGNVLNMNGEEWVDHTPSGGTCGIKPRWQCTNIYDVSVSASNKVWISGASGHVWMNDGSGTGGWTQHSGSSNWETSSIFGISALEVDGNNRVWIAGASGNVWKYNDTSWLEETGTGEWENIQLNSVSFLSEDEVWVAGDDGNVWKCAEAATWAEDSCTWTDYTPTGGARWCDNDPCTNDVNSISAYSSTDVWLVADGGHVWRYNGTSWSRFCGTGLLWDSTDNSCSGSDPDRWGTTDILDVSNRFSTEEWIVSGSGKVWEYNLPRWEVDACSPTNDCGTDDDVVINDITYNRNFYMENVCRSTSAPYEITGITDNSGAAVGFPSTDANYEADPCDDADSGGANSRHDPSTLKVTVSVDWDRGETITRSEFITRLQGGGCLQTKWSTSGSTDAQICSPSVDIEEYSSFSNLTTEDSDGTVKMSSPVTSVIGTLVSAVHDTTEVGDSDRGAAFNSVTWIGSEVNDTRLRYRIATSDCPDGSTNAPTCDTGTWTYKSIKNSCATGGNSWVDGSTNVSIRVDCSDHQNKRYFKYEFQFCSLSNCAAVGTGDSVGPKLNDVIINWSP